jgi:hypothetical protein
MSALIIPFPDAGFGVSERLEALMTNQAADQVAAEIGTAEDWAWSAVSYLKAALTGTCGGTLGGSVEVSAAAVGLLLTYVERLASEQGIIPVSGGDA